MRGQFFTAMSRLIHKANGTRIFYGLVLLFVGFISLYLRHLTNLAPMDDLLVANKGKLRQNINLDHTLNFRARPGVQTCTSWKAPIIWKGMFDPNLYDEKHQNQSSVALTVFAVGSQYIIPLFPHMTAAGLEGLGANELGFRLTEMTSLLKQTKRYLDAYLKDFLTSAEQHFMLGLPVIYYVFTDLPEKMPNIELAPQRSLKVILVEKHSRWQDISMMRMKTISEAIESDIRHHCNYVFCFDVDQVFKGRFGSEALGDSVALLHAHYYRLPKEKFTYDRNSKSKAFMETGDFYYHAALFGGSWENVKNLADACYLSIMEDKLNDVEALWHDESHLNKYFWLHKPSRILSPEYCWDESIYDRSDIHVSRLVWAPKHYDRLRSP